MCILRLELSAKILIIVDGSFVCLHKTAMITQATAVAESRRATG